MVMAFSPISAFSQALRSQGRSDLAEFTEHIDKKYGFICGGGVEKVRKGERERAWDG